VRLCEMTDSGLSAPHDRRRATSEVRASVALRSNEGDLDCDILTTLAFLSPRPIMAQPSPKPLREGHMAIDVPTVAAPRQAAVSTALPVAASFDKKWACEFARLP
jgi:hypothetical protein